MNSTLPDRETLYAEIHDLIDQASDEVFEEVVVTPTPSDLEGCTLEERFGRLDIFKRPVLFIYTEDASNNLKISETVIEQISNIDVALNVVAVCGLYRTGKSYLMNRLANEKKGFALGSTVQSETKGIWAWCKPHPKQKDQVLLLLDTEGLGDVAKGDTNHDNKMFSLTLLLCSTLIYNNTGVFNQEALDKLAFITELTESIKVTSSSRRDENEDLMGIVTPMFIMCLRDFYLELKSTNGKVITEDEYFEECLANSADEKGKDSYNKTRSCIKRYFPRRKCFTLAQPVGSKKLARIEQLPDNALDEDFVDDVTRLQEFVYDCEPKFVDGMTQKLVDGPAFECFARTYVDALQKNSSLTFEKAFEQASKFHNSKLVVKLVHEFEFELQKISLPVKSKQALNEECFGYMNRVLKVYRNQAYPYKSEFFESKAVSKMKKISEHKLEENRTVVQKVLLDALEKQHNKIIIANQDQFDRKEGSELYRQCIDHLKLEFQNDMKEYDQDELITAIVNFKLRIKDEKMRIGFQARMHEERERSEQLRKEVQETLKSHFESKLEDIKAERLKEMEKEMKKFQRNLTERKGLETVKGMSFFKRFKLLFR